jgi:hypothetical protein
LNGLNNYERGFITMNYPYQITVIGRQRLKNSHENIQFGHYFVFRQVPQKPKVHLARLRLRKAPSEKEVLPIVNQSFLRVGDHMTVKLMPRSLELVGCLVSNRDLYRAECDPVHLFIAVPKPPAAELRLQVTWNETPFGHRVVTLQEGVAIETFALLLPGRYTARLTSGEQQIGMPVNFTVAEYQLAPLVGRLVSHQLDRESQYLWFELAVDSYQQPFTEKLIVELIEDGKAIARVGLLPVVPGQYSGGLPLSGEQALRLRLIAAADPDKIAEVVIPGSRKQERQVSVISELGQKFGFAMMPEPQAIPLRGGYLSKAEVLATPLQVEEIVTNQRLLKVRDDVEALTLVHLDLITGVYSTQSIGDVAADSTVTVASTGTLSMTFVGAFVDGEPFEAYTTFIQPPHFDLSLDTPNTLKPRENLVIRLGCEGVSKTVPVLVCVRDARLTATERPAVSLGAAAKRNIDAAIADMNEWAFVGWEELATCSEQEFQGELFEEISVYMAYERYEQAEELLRSALEKYPATLTYRLKLLEVLAAANKQDELKQENKLLRAMTGGKGEIWQRAQELVPALDGNLLLLGGAVAAESAALCLPSEDDLSLDDLGGADDHLSLDDLSLGDDLSLDDDGLGLDFELADEPNVAAAPATIAAPAKTSAPPAAAPSTPSPPQTRTEFPEMLFYGIVPVTETSRDLVLPVGEALTTWVVETFALRHGDWAQARTTVVVDQPVRIDLEVPPAVYPQDDVVGRLHVVTASGTARLRLHCDDQPVELHSGQLTVCDPDFITTPAELEFLVKPGHYQATVEDIHTHDTDSIETTVQEPTKVKSYRKALQLLQRGETVTLESTNAVTLRLLPTLDTPFDALITATADYAHLCCEQTAAKILAAAFMYLTASSDWPRRQAEQIMITGIAREQKMFQQGRGFTMYPDWEHISEYYSQCAVFYLWRLQPLEALPELSSSLRQAVQEGLDMANQVATVHGLQRIPERITRIEDAYTLATLQQKPEEIRQFIDALLELTSHEVRLRNPSNRVADRTVMAYVAASLIALKDWQLGLRLANQVTQQFNAQGRLYSTVDSVAALALLQQIKLADIAIGTGQVRMNAKMMTLEEALIVAEPVTSIEVMEGVVAVEVTYSHTEDWESFGQPFPITVDFRETHSAGQKKKRFTLGNRLTLQIALPQGYRLGDIAHIVLPPCLSAIEGGAKVKRLTLDFAGRHQLQIPLLVTSKLQGIQHFAICVRNMFEEERASSTGLLTVTGDTY